MPARSNRPEYRFYLTRLWLDTRAGGGVWRTTRIGELFEARGWSYDQQLNQPGSARFSHPIEESRDTIVEEIHVGIRGIEIERNGTVVWSGPVWTTEEDADSRAINVTCVGWLQYLSHRIIRNTIGLAADGLPFRKEYEDQLPGNIIFDLVDYANTQPVPALADPTGGQVIVPTPITKHSMLYSGTQISIAYEPYQKIGDAIRGLTELENGPDISIDPATRQMTVWSPYQGQESVGEPDWLGMRKPWISFDCNTGKHNAENVVRNIDMSVVHNRFTATGNAEPGFVEDTESEKQFGVFEDHADLGEVFDPEVLLVYAGVEVAILGNPFVQYTVQPMITSAHNPEPFVDYGIGDVIRINVDIGSRFRVFDQDVRIYGFSVTVSDMGEEKVTSIATNPQSGGAGAGLMRMSGSQAVAEGAGPGA